MSWQLDILREMLELYSPTGSEDQVSSFLVDLFRSEGLEAYKDEAGNFIGIVGRGQPEIMLLGHIDTVPGKIPVREEDGKLYGRGAVDAKGPMAAFVCAAIQAKRQDGVNATLKVVGAVGEEGDSRGARYLVKNHLPEYLIIGEPSGWDSIVLGYKGSMHVHYVLNKSMSHSAGPERSAAEEALDFWNHVVEFCRELNQEKRVFDQLSPSLRSINTYSDGFISTVEMDINFRLPLAYSPDDLGQRLRDFAGKGKISILYGDPAFKADKNTPLVRAFMQSLRSVGVTPRFKVKTGTSDMNVVAPEWRCPAIAYGPGDSSLDHTPEEHIYISEYEKSIDILVKALKYLEEA
ncbi:N-acetyl-ornithine/N-acetyl-lysine deacetylase [Thermobaculum terrenum ATCC BAA-798]|uniref:Putative [LysW]-lysine hydrolase n=1 Tax=Thermobaculum terrenum (strain ATCC BAA-798 / CCMEE 7001 / YNP1) TaxID=525904 RepID=D1CE83_THET1|nr:[LysW]-lysine hydrolase [Thermobaculum terrenum]ACZ41239.1 N-acetyl-ornithine/N-acetyl-lysine deacetylase [Thermobaculum terrenum ATCC BAA-798]